MAKYSEIIGENQDLSRVFMKQVAMCYDGGNDGEVQAGSTKITFCLSGENSYKTCW